MRKILLVGALIATLSSGTIWGAKGEETITVSVSAGDIVCDIGQPGVALQCGGKPCKENDKIWWEVRNQIDKEIQVIIMNLKHLGTSARFAGTNWYIDPLVGPGSAATHRVQVEPGETKTLKTKVRKEDGEAFGGEYKYDIGFKTRNPDQTWNPWEKCADPRVHIQD